MTRVTARAHGGHGKDSEKMYERLQTSSEDRACRGEVLRQTVPGTCSSNRKFPVTDGGETDATDNQTDAADHRR